MKSSRLQLKAMREIKGEPMIKHIIDRLKLAKNADKIILCTSTNKQDDILVDVAMGEGISYFRGSEEDVLERLLEAAKKFKIDFMVNVTADNPLVDFIYIDKMIDIFKNKNADYITCKKLPWGTFSYGLKVKALEKVVNEKKSKDTEIWGKIFESYDDLKKIDLEVEADLNHPEIRLTVDEEADLNLIKKIFDRFYNGKNDLDNKKIVKFLLENPHIKDINKGIIPRR